MFGNQGTEEKDEEISQYIPQGFRPGTIGKVVTIQTFERDTEHSGQIKPGTLNKFVGVLLQFRINMDTDTLAFTLEGGPTVYLDYEDRHIEIYIHS